MNNLAMWMMEVNDFAVGRSSCCAKRWTCAASVLGPEHADVAGTMTLLAGVLIETRRYDEALTLAADARPFT